MRVAKKTVHQSLDSLLDTMTNAVGILLVVLLVIQLNMADAAKRILGKGGEQPTVSAEQLQATEEEARELHKSLDELKARWSKLGKDSQTAIAELPDLQKLLAGLRSELKRDKPEGPDPAELRKTVAERQRRAKDLERQVTKAQDDLDRLKAALAQAPARQKPKASVVRLPDPHAAPPSADAVLFLCRHGRVIMLGEDMQKSIPQGVRAALGGVSSDQIAIAPTQFGLVANYFDTHVVGNESLRWRVLNAGSTLILKLEWQQPSAGETLAELQRGGSSFERQVSALNRQQKYVSFFVWGDSFDTYLAARSIVEGKGLSAGWTAYAPSEEIHVDLFAKKKAGGSGTETD